MNKLANELVEVLENLVDAVNFYNRYTQSEREQELAFANLITKKDAAQKVLDKLNPGGLADE